MIGIPTLAATDPQLGGSAPGIGFAIPSNVITNIADQLIKTGKVTHSNRAALGVTVRTVQTTQGQLAGAGIVHVSPGGAAARAGLQPGDVIVSVAGQPVTSAQALTVVLGGHQPGQTVNVTIVTATGARRTVAVTLGQLGS